MAKKKAGKRAPARKKTARRSPPARKAARKAARKSTAKTARKAARKAATKTARKPARKAARKAARKVTRKAAPRATREETPRRARRAASEAAPKTARKGAARKRKATPAEEESSPVEQAEPEAPPAAQRVRKRLEPIEEEVETTSAGIQPLAPEHAPVDELTSSGNELLDIFQKYDRNRTGYIEKREFVRLLEALGHEDMTDEEIEIALDSVDTDASGRISWKEFKRWWSNRW